MDVWNFLSQKPYARKPAIKTQKAQNTVKIMNQARENWPNLIPVPHATLNNSKQEPSINPANRISPNIFSRDFDTIIFQAPPF
jgi:hypothetical protein